MSRKLARNEWKDGVLGENRWRKMIWGWVGVCQVLWNACLANFVPDVMMSNFCLDWEIAFVVWSTKLSDWMMILICCWFGSLICAFPLNVMFDMSSYSWFLIWFLIWLLRYEFLSCLRYGFLMLFLDMGLWFLIWIFWYDFKIWCLHYGSWCLIWNLIWYLHCFKLILC